MRMYEEDSYGEKSYIRAYWIYMRFSYWNCRGERVGLLKLKNDLIP